MLTLSNTDLVGNVVDGDVMHGCSVTLEQSMEVGPTMSETENRLIIYIFLPVIRLYNIQYLWYKMPTTGTKMQQNCQSTHLAQHTLTALSALHF